MSVTGRVAAAIVGTIAFWGGSALVAGPASANVATCDQMHAAIVVMDRDSMKPPGYALLRKDLLQRLVLCYSTSRGPMSETELAARAARVAAECAGAGEARSICELGVQVGESCRAPLKESLPVCKMLLGEDYQFAQRAQGQEMPALPPLTVTLDGHAYVVSPKCAATLFATTGATLGGQQFSLKDHCPDILAALERRTGVAVAGGRAFVEAVRDLVMANFPPRGAPPMNAVAINAHPDFQKMCKEAQRLENDCRARQGRMRSYDEESTGKKGQAGAFDDCANLYGKVGQMCTATETAAATPPAAATRPRQIPLRDRPKPQPESKPNPGQSRPPPASLGMSAACKAQLNQLMEAADRNDGQRATELYGAMRSGCDQAMRGLSQDVDMALPERKTGNLSKSYFGCQGPNCGVAPSTPEQMAQAAANAVYPEDVMRFVFAVAGFAIGVAGYYTPVQSGYIVRSPQFSTVNQRVRSTYGQGGPTHVQPHRNSKITGEIKGN